jgi:hypothetical protein
MRKEMKTDRVRNKEVQQFWKLCKGLRNRNEIIAPRDIMPLDTGNRRAARAPTLEDIDRGGGGRTRSLRQMLPLAEARQY